MPTMKLWLQYHVIVVWLWLCLGLSSVFVEPQDVLEAPGPTPTSHSGALLPEDRDPVQPDVAHGQFPPPSSFFDNFGDAFPSNPNLHLTKLSHDDSSFRNFPGVQGESSDPHGNLPEEMSVLDKSPFLDDFGDFTDFSVTDVHETETGGPASMVDDASIKMRQSNNSAAALDVVKEFDSATEHISASDDVIAAHFNTPSLINHNAASDNLSTLLPDLTMTTVHSLTDVSHSGEVNNSAKSSLVTAGDTLFNFDNVPTSDLTNTKNLDNEHPQVHSVHEIPPHFTFPDLFLGNFSAPDINTLRRPQNESPSVEVDSVHRQPPPTVINFNDIFKLFNNPVTEETTHVPLGTTNMNLNVGGDDVKDLEKPFGGDSPIMISNISSTNPDTLAHVSFNNTSRPPSDIFHVYESETTPLSFQESATTSNAIVSWSDEGKVEITTESMLTSSGLLDVTSSVQSTEDSILAVTSAITLSTIKEEDITNLAVVTDVPLIAATNNDTTVENIIGMLTGRNETSHKINKHPPVFENSPYEALIPQNVPQDFVIFTGINITDNDNIESVIVKCLPYIQFPEVCDYFQVVPVSVDQSSFNGSLVLLKPLPIPTKTAYQVKLVAMDEDFNSTTTVTVVIVDEKVIEEAIMNETLANETQARFEFDKLLISFPDFKNTNEMPRFSADNVSISVPEDLPPGSLLPNLNLLVMDDDLGQNASFEVKILDPHGMFHLESNFISKSGNIIVRLNNNSQLDFEDPDAQDIAFLICVECSESRTDSNRTVLAVVEVNIRDVNDNWPAFDQETYMTQVLEDAPAGTIIARLNASDKDSGKFGNAGLRYSLDGSDAANFQINSESGIVMVASCNNTISGNCLDYETTKHYTLMAIVADEEGYGLSQTAVLEIEVKDSNDNAPRFTHPVYVTDLKLGATNFSTPLFVKATDRDVTSTIAYSLLHRDPHPFLVNEETGEVTLSRDGVEQLADALSHRLSLTVMATDGVHRDTALINITLRDDNQYAPVFTFAIYNASISDATRPGTGVVQIMATDRDLASGSQVSYFIRYGGQGNFLLNSATGLISVSPHHHLDYDRQTEYNLQVVAVDGGLPSQSGTAQVIVSVTDGNNKSPLFTPLVQRVYVKEETPLHSIVHQLSAVDSDMTIENALQFELQEVMTVVNQQGAKINSQDIALKPYFTIEPSGKVRVASALSRDSTALVSMLVTVVDTSAELPQTGTGTLIVSLVGESGHSPIFPYPWTPEHPHLFVDAKEENPIGSLILSVITTDPDSNAQRFRIKPPNPFVEVNSTSGLITLKSRIDYETMTTFSFILESYEDEHPTRLAIANVTVNVIDVNDHTPKFLKSLYRADVEENSMPGTLVANVSAVDKDSGELGQLTYTLEGDHNEDFVVSPDGILTVAPGAVLDREAQDFINLYVTATDQEPEPSKRKFAMVPVVITLIDQNDQPPVFEPREFTATIVPTMLPGQPVLQVLASDGDVGINAAIKYTIESGNDDGIFSINTTSGVISLSTHAPGGAAEYRLEVSGRDQNGLGPHQDTASVSIFVAEMNAHAPKFTSPNESELFVKENQPAGTILVTVRAEDIDLGENGRVSYYLNNGTHAVYETEKFAVSPTTGTIVTKVPLDREENNRYQLLVVAKDNGSPHSLETVFVLLVHVEDTDDNLPAFPLGPFSRPYSFRVSENQPKRTQVGQIEAHDPDNSINGEIFYQITAGNEDDHFVIDPDLGIIRTNEILDHESKKDYHLVVKASNHKIPQDSFLLDPESRQRRDNANTSQLMGQDASAANVHIKVEDENDNAPVFIGLPYQTGVKYTAKVGEFVTKVTAVDPDGDPVMYSLLASHLFRTRARVSSGAVVPQPFAIDASGKITTTSLLTSYNQDRFQVSVVAKEGTFPHRETKATVEVWVYEPGELLRVVVARPKDEILPELPDYIETLSNMTKGSVYVDDIRYHLTNKNEIDKDGTDLYIHVVDPEAFVIKSVPEVLEMVDSTLYYYPEYHRLHLTSVEPVYTPVTQEPFNPAMAALIALLVVLFIGFLIIIFICCCTHYWVKEKKVVVVKKKKIIPTITRSASPTLYFSSFKENPLWMEQKLKPYEEQELSMQVFADMMDPLADGAGTVYATVRPGGHSLQGSIGSASVLEAAMNLSDDYATLERQVPTDDNGPTPRNLPSDSPPPVPRHAAPPSQPRKDKAPNAPALVINHNGEPVMIGELL